MVVRHNEGSPAEFYLAEGNPVPMHHANPVYVVITKLSERLVARVDQ